MSDYTHTSFETGESVHAPHPVAAVTPTIPPLALLYSDESLLAHVESALDEIGAPVVYRATVAKAERAALLDAKPGITLINLDDCCDEHIEQVTAWLDAAHVPVVFNDADISRGLEGWARARWARHLGAKLRGSADVDPPRPVHAEPAQKPSSTAVQSDESAEPAQEFQIASAEGIEIVPIASRPLTPGEIRSLLADFPAELTVNTEEIFAPVAVLPAQSVNSPPIETAAANDETDALSAHVDAMLAEDSLSADAEPAPWEVIAPLEDPPAVASATEHAASQGIPNSSHWQLVDDPSPVVSAPSERAAQPAPAPRIEFDFELEPLEQFITAVVREREFEEMRLDKVAAKNPEAGE